MMLKKKIKFRVPAFVRPVTLCDGRKVICAVCETSGAYLGDVRIIAVLR